MYVWLQQRTSKNKKQKKAEGLVGIMGKITQKDLVIHWLMKGKTLTPLEALQNGMGMRLSAIIHTLRHEYEMNIKDIGKKHFAEYKLFE